MKPLLSTFILFYCLSAWSQYDQVLTKFNQYDFSKEEILNAIQGAYPSGEFSFDLIITTETEGETETEKAAYTPTQNPGERWTLISSNGKTPSKEKRKSFDKEFNKKDKIIKRQVIDDSWGVKNDADKYLIIEFKYAKSSLLNRYKFLANCTGQAYLNKSTNKLEKIEFNNDKPLKAGLMKTNNLQLVSYYKLDETANTYYLSKEILKMDVKAFGQTVKLIDVYEYKNYQKM